MSDNDFAQLKFFIKKKKAGLLTQEDNDKLIAILSSASKHPEVFPAGVKVAIGILLANAIGRQKPKELNA